MLARFFSAISAVVVVFAMTGCGEFEKYLDKAGDINKVIGGGKLNTSEVDSLLAEITSINTELTNLSGTIYQSSEAVHAALAPYRAGQFPILTYNWETVKAELDRNPRSKKARSKLKTYEEQMALRGVVAAEMLKDKSKRKALLKKLKVTELEQLKGAAKALRDIPSRNKAAIARIPKLAGRSKGIVTDLLNQIKANPLVALDAQKLVKRVNTAIKEVKAMPKLLKKQLSAVQDLIKMLEDLL